MRSYILEKPALFMAVGISAIYVLGVLPIWIYSGDMATDFGVYWRTSNGPLSSVYSPDHVYPFPYAPTMLLWIEPLSLIPLWLSYVLWISFSAGALYWACRRHLTKPEALLVLLCPPAANALLTGQVAIFLGAALLWAFTTDRRLFAGLALGAVATIKPHLVLMVPMLLLVRRDWLAMTGAAIAFLYLVGLALILFGSAIWFDWLGTLGNFRNDLHSMNIIRTAATPASVADKFGLSPLPFLALGAVVGAYLVYRCRNLGPLETTAAATAGSLLAAPYALTYDLVALAPFLVWAAFRGSVISAVALAGTPHPLPLCLAAVRLWKGTDAQPVRS